MRLLQFVVNIVNCRNHEGAVTALKKTVTDFNDQLTVAENSKIYSPSSNAVVHPGADLGQTDSFGASRYNQKVSRYRQGIIDDDE